jgi:hypothetical protein
VKPLALAVPAVFFFASCAAYHAQHGNLGHPAAPTAAETIAPAPAPAPVATVASNDPLSIQQALLVKQIDEFREDLKANGKYDCCVKPACRQCAMTAGECHCRQVISANGPCCGECTQSWVDGKGNTEGVDREQVLAHLGCLRELYDKKVPDGMTPPGTKKQD